MTDNKLTRCIDVGTENCPCFLAVTGDCLTCTRLQGKEYCDCQWSGSCVYNEYIQSGKRINNPRGEILASIVDKIGYDDGLYIYALKVGQGFAIKCDTLGTYVFMRPAGEQGIYDTPISIMSADASKGLIHVAVKAISAKTKKITEEEVEFTIRGPYRNGLLGIKKFLEKKGKTLILCRGVGISPAITLANKLNSADIIVDDERTNKQVAEDYLKDIPVNLQYLTLSDQMVKKQIAGLMEKEEYDRVAILASDFFISEYGKLTSEVLPKAAIAVSNNFNMCCGEGVCGACTMVDETGCAYKMCKCQTNAKAIFKDYK